MTTQQLLKRIKKQREARKDITADMMILTEMCLRGEINEHQIAVGIGTGMSSVYSLLWRTQKKIFNVK